MTGVKLMRGPIAMLAFAGTLAGCGGVATTPSNALLPVTQMRPAGAPVGDFGCPSDKGVSVKPCAVRLTAAKTEVTVTTKGPVGGTFTISAMGCKTRMIAKVKASAGAYKISAGTRGKGQCVATFIDYDSAKKRLGAAKVIIVNSVEKKRHK
jgi:hypothetical protein